MTILQLSLQLEYDIEQEKMYTILEFQYLFFEEPVKTINYLCFVYFTTLVYITEKVTVTNRQEVRLKVGMFVLRDMFNYYTIKINLSVSKNGFDEQLTSKHNLTRTISAVFNSPLTI